MIFENCLFSVIMSPVWQLAITFLLTVAVDLGNADYGHQVRKDSALHCNVD
jgi:hypothetical protein